MRSTAMACRMCKESWQYGPDEDLAEAAFSAEVPKSHPNKVPKDEGVGTYPGEEDVKLWGEWSLGRRNDAGYHFIPALTTIRYFRDPTQSLNIHGRLESRMQ